MRSRGRWRRPRRRWVEGGEGGNLIEEGTRGRGAEGGGGGSLVEGGREARGVAHGGGAGNVFFISKGGALAGSLPNVSA